MSFSVYAPVVSSEQPAFYAALTEYFLSLPLDSTPFILCDDFNNVLDPSLDSSRPTPRPDRGAGSSRLLLSGLGLTDAYRALHPTGQVFTNRSGQGRAARRLDRLYVSASLRRFFPWSATLVPGSSPSRSHFGSSGAPRRLWGRLTGSSTSRFWPSPGCLLSSSTGYVPLWPPTRPTLHPHERWNALKALLRLLLPLAEDVVRLPAVPNPPLSRLVCRLSSAGRSVYRSTSGSAKTPHIVALETPNGWVTSVLSIPDDCGDHFAGLFTSRLTDACRPKRLVGALCP
jgi:hypothetical protein